MDAYDAVRPDEPAVLDYTFVSQPMTHRRAKALQRALLDVLPEGSSES